MSKEMKGRCAVVFFLLAGCVSIYGQQLSEAESLMKFMGSDDPEEIDAGEAERLADYMEHPLKINVTSLSALKSSGLMSHYQAASLYDYRCRHGDVLSLAELAAVDGFGEHYVSLLAPFISLASQRTPGSGADDAMKAAHDVAAKGGLKLSGSEKGPPASWNYGGKYRLSLGERLRMAAGFNGDVFSGYVSYRSRRVPLKVIAGDFNARFGQGLALWNGMTMSGLSVPDSYLKRTSYISESWSYSGTSALTGLAMEYSAGSFNISMLVALPGIRNLHGGLDEVSVLPGVNLSWDAGSMHVGFTHYAMFSGALSKSQTYIPDMKTALDMSACLRGTDVFAEAAYDWLNVKAAFLAGCVFPAGDDLKMAAMLRFYPHGYSSSMSGAARSSTKCTNEYSASFSGRFTLGRRNGGNFSADAAYFPDPKDDSGRKSLQFKAALSWEWKPVEELMLTFRLSERIRTWGVVSKTAVRTEMLWNPSPFCLRMRMEYLHHSGDGILGYVEGGYVRQRFSAYARQGIFFIDEWDDRIYAYERDAPGSFNVPAFYGRGVWSSLTGMWRYARWGRLYFRFSITSYPFMEEKKPGKAELKLQAVFSF